MPSSIHVTDLQPKRGMRPAAAVSGIGKATLGCSCGSLQPPGHKAVGTCASSFPQVKPPASVGDEIQKGFVLHPDRQLAYKLTAQ